MAHPTDHHSNTARRPRRRRLLAASFAASMLAFLMAGTATAGAQVDTSRFVYTGGAYGTKVSALGGVVSSGPTALIGLGCNSPSGLQLSNTVATVTAPPVLTSGTVSTTAATSGTGTDVESKTTATTQAVTLLAGAITADAVTAASATSHDATGFHTSSDGSVFVNLKVLGVPVSATPASNTTITLPGLGFVILNQQHVSKSGRALTVNMIHVVVNIANPLIPTGTEAIVSHAASDLEGPVTGLLDGSAYGTSAKVAPVVRSGPTAVVGVGCLGTGGKVHTNTLAGINVPGVISSGTITDTAQGSIKPHALSSETTATVEGANVVNGLVSADVVTADAHASSDGSTSTFSDAGSSFLNLSVQGHPELSGNPPANTTVVLPGLGTLYLHRVIQHAHSIEVRMIELVVGQNGSGLPVGLDIRIAVAEASVH
jgi:hypothetical protein